MIAFLATAALFGIALGSSHSEAPGTAKSPTSDLSDFYIFRTPAREDCVTIVANINPLIQSQSGPNYNPVDEGFVYQLHIDNNGDAHEDITAQFIFGSRLNNATANGIEINGNSIPLVAFAPYNSANAPGQDHFLNAIEYYKVRVMRGEDYLTPLDVGDFATGPDRAAGPAGADGTQHFAKAFQYTGAGVFGNDLGYDDYVTKTAIYDGNIDFPGCSAGKASMFVGPRRDTFGIALGKVFDLINIPGVTGANGQAPETNSLDRSGVISIVLELPTACVLDADRTDDVIGAWASVREIHHTHTGAHVAGPQTSRLANPLINELIIGLPDKDAYSRSHPSDDYKFRSYFEAPSVPAIIELLFPAAKAPAFLRTDLMAVLLNGFDIPVSDLLPRGFDLLPDNNAARKRNVGTGVNGEPVVHFNIGHDDDDDDSSSSTSSSSSAGSSSSSETTSLGLVRAPEAPNKPLKAQQVVADDRVFADMMRINLAIGPVPRANQNSLGVAGLDLGGFPNGRRLGDDVVDIVLRVAMGALCHPPFDAAIGICKPEDAPAGAIPFTDQVPTSACSYADVFPYVNRPVAGDISPATAVPGQFVANC